MKVVSCALRLGVSGWEIITGGDHYPLGVSGVTSDSSKLRLSYDFTADRIHGLIASPNADFAAQDRLCCGASVGYSYSDIQFGKPGVSGPVDPSTLTTSGGEIHVYGEFS